MVPLVSVYIPTYNRAAMVRRALTSVTAQTWPALDVIVVDDGSSPAQRKRLDELSQAFPIRLLDNRFTKGACGARNTAIEAAEGEFITGLDDDDEFLPEHIGAMMARFRAGDCSCVASSVQVHTPTGTSIRDADSGLISLDSLLHYNKIGNQVLTRTEWLRAIGGFDESMPAFQDYDTWVRLVARFGPAAKLSSAGYVLHQEHEGERISTSGDRRRRALALFMEKHASLLSSSHKRSLQLLQLRCDNQGIGFRDLLRLCSRQNWKSACSLFMDTRYPRLAITLRRLKSGFRGR